MVMEQSLLTREQRELLECLSRNAYIRKTFYFTGGTALAEVYLHHRFSEDFDFFSEAPLDIPGLDAAVAGIQKCFQPENTERQTLHQQLTLFFRKGESVVKVDFAYFPFEHLGEFKIWHNLRVASLVDIAVNKVHALTTRKRGRDFLDLMLIMKRERLTPGDLQKQYRLKFDMYLSDEELSKHFAGIADAIDQPRYLGDISWKEVEAFFRQQARGLTIVR